MVNVGINYWPYVNKICQSSPQLSTKTSVETEQCLRNQLITWTNIKHNGNLFSFLTISGAVQMHDIEIIFLGRLFVILPNHFLKLK